MKVRIHFWYKPSMGGKQHATVDAELEVQRAAGDEEVLEVAEDVLNEIMADDLTSADAGVDDFGAESVSYDFQRPATFKTLMNKYKPA